MFVAITTKELDTVCKQIVKEELTEGDVNALIEEVTHLVDSSREIASGLRARLLEAAAAIDEEEPKGEKEKGSAEVKEKEYEPTSTVMLLIPFLSVDDNVLFTSATQLAQYVKVKLAKYNKKASPSGPSLHKKNDNGLNHPVEDPHEQILSNADELVKLTKLKKSLKKFYTQLTIQGNQDDVNWPDIFSHILESIVTDRIQYIYKKN